MQTQTHPSILLAGASGVVGRRLGRMLVDDGYRVIGLTRSPEKAATLASLGIEPVIGDVFDAESLGAILAQAQPEIVIHQLTDLPPGLEPAQMAAGLRRTAQLRELGTRNLLAAALAAHTRRLIAQSIAFVYAPGPLPYEEHAPLHVDAPDLLGLTARAVASLEQQIVQAPLEGIVLRYGKFYGPGTGFDQPATGGAVHVDAAADAARRAVTSGRRGIYNIVEEDGTVSSRKAARELGWRDGFRLPEPTP